MLIDLLDLRLVTSSFTLLPISSLISLTLSIGLFLGSSSFQSKTFGKKSVGQDSLSMHPIFTVLYELRIMSSVISLDFWLLISIPISFITSIATGLICETGLVPALIPIYPSGPYVLKNPSAI